MDDAKDAMQYLATPSEHSQPPHPPGVGWALQRPPKRIIQRRPLGHLSALSIPAKHVVVLFGARDALPAILGPATTAAAALVEHLLAARALQLDEVPAVGVAALVKLLADGLELGFVRDFLLSLMGGLTGGGGGGGGGWGQGGRTLLQWSRRSGGSLESMSRQASTVPRTLSRMTGPMTVAMSLSARDEEAGGVSVAMGVPAPLLGCGGTKWKVSWMRRSARPRSARESAASMIWLGV